MAFDRAKTMGLGGMDRVRQASVGEKKSKIG
jgi:hypothetical protein